ncbi:Probable receptor-like protein kinase [Striga hermonthica]|uniref:Probable receptor-like protein kinase n=1 Tax=Striga hermonthica TaxID=68872 RepID=A0A9N7N5W3_STRHE|nr:Probable receptor-like protein kinase [Striga hermonthica]
MRFLPLLVMFMLCLCAKAQTTSFLINCGTNSTVNVGGRRWVGDTSPESNFTLSSNGIEAFSSVYNGDPAYRQLYQSARIFTGSLNYTFALPNGDYLLRLYFSQLAFDGYNPNNSYFSVEANGLRLVSEFNVPGEIAEKNLHQSGNSSYSSILKEYFFPVSTGSIVLDFAPRKGSFGFVNAIEILPEEENGLFTDSASRVGSNSGNASLGLSRRGIETMYRLNVGGSSIGPTHDSLWRRWEVDSSYMVNSDAGSEIRNRSNITYANPNETFVAPLSVYESARTLTNTGVLENRFNMSWKLEVDPDFEYLVRLHFCELVYDRPNQRIFRIFIDNKTASDNYDVYARAGGMNRAYHEDYVDFISEKTNTLWIQLGPDSTTGSAGTDALLNGLEVFKLSKNGNLAYVQSYSDVKKDGKKNFEAKKSSPPGWRPLILNGSIVSSTTGNQNPNGQLGGTIRSGRRFTLTEIKAATNSFDESLVIGVGGFGKVYKGEIDDTVMAVKRSNPQSQQGLTEFETEIELLSKLRHRHLVSLIGFCDEQNEIILVYEYMANGTLRAHLFGAGLPSLTWKQRLEICIGAARGLHYLHTGSDRGIIHRDVKTTNILLDEGFVAKMSDFGLSKTGPSLEHTHVSTAVKGSFGYLDPEYFRRQQLTEKSDVYSFGVVLFEVACARPVINPALPRDEINLAEWALRWQKKKLLERIVDKSLVGKFCPESLAGFGEIAEKCLAEEGRKRPTMGEVLWHLEYVLQLHEAWSRGNGGNGPDDGVGRDLGPVEEGKVEEELARDLGPMGVGFEEFSQMVNQQGRGQNNLGSEVTNRSDHRSIRQLTRSGRQTYNWSQRLQLCLVERRSARRSSRVYLDSRRVATPPDDGGSGRAMPGDWLGVSFSPVRVPVETNDGLDERDCVVETGVDVNAVLLVVLKVFFVVVLALGTKRLTVGITISAFVLFLLEYVCKHAPAVLKPCSRAKGALKTIVVGVLKLLRFKEVNPDEDNFSKLGGLSYEGQKEVEDCSRYFVKNVLDEIQLQPEDEMIEEGSCQEMEFKEAVPMEKEKSKMKSKKFKLNSKMKKFIPKN